METSVPISNDIQLIIRDHLLRDDRFPTSRLQKGFLLFHQGKDLSAEAVGFGVPVIKCGLRTIFPGGVVLSAIRQDKGYQVDAQYLLNLEEKTLDAKDGKALSRFLDKGKLVASAFIRRFPWLRKPLMKLSKQLRSTFRWKTEYQLSDMTFQIPIHYHFKHNRMAVSVDLSRLKDNRISEIVIMNEQGAEFFSHYRDTSKKEIHDKEIGCWDEVNAREATFFDPKHKISFSLEQIPGAKLFLGLELDNSRLAWSGFGYTFLPRRKEFEYTLKIGDEG